MAASSAGRGRKPRTATVAPVERKAKALPVNDGSFELSLPELVHVMRVRAGFTSHQALADAARAFVPGWVPMNRRLIQMIERGDLSPAEVNDVELLAIARACKEDPKKVFGIARGESPDLDPLIDLFEWAFGKTTK